MSRVPSRATSLRLRSLRAMLATAIGLSAIGVTLTTSTSAHTPAATWSYASSDHFEAYAAGDEKHVREVIVSFERIHTVFEHLLNAPQNDVLPTRLVVFATAKDFAPYRLNDNANAFSLSTPDGDFIVMHSLNTDALPVAMHEYTHLMIGRTGTDYPLWLNEGLAQFYSTMTLQEAKVRLGLELPHAMETLRKSKQLIPLDRLFAIDERATEDNDPRIAPLLYAECWALTHMLLMHDQYRERTPALLTAVASGTPAARAVSEAYGKTLEMIAADLKKYVARFKVDSRVVDAPVGSNGARVTSRAADEADVAVTLAAVLGWQPGREDEGRAGMAALEAHAPESLRLAEARGLLENYTSHCDTARTYLAKAVALGSANPAVLRAYANIIAGSDPEEQNALRKRADAIAPENGAGHTRLALIPCGGGTD